MYNEENFQELFQKYLENKCSPEEAEWLLSYLENNQQDELPQQLIEKQLAKRLGEIHTSDPVVREKLEIRLQKILEQTEAPVIPMQTGVRPFRWSSIAAAAIFLVLVGTGVYFLVNYNTEKVVAKIQAGLKPDVLAPASAHATITLANGKQIVLDSAGNGMLATQSNINIKKLGDGAIGYTGSATEISYNTLTNPKGSKVVNLILADGTQVWLNAASSLTYPIAFTGHERKVAITGEAYFEVTHNAAMPFEVVKGDVEVTVLGTHFNVNAYDDEDEIKVTLLEGSVKVSQLNTRDWRIIKPGQQAILIQNSELRTRNAVDLEQVMSWKNGMFHFEGTNIEEIMRQVARWYDVEINYQVKTVNLNFSGVVSRRANVSELLKIMELTGLVHFKIDGNKISVQK